MIKIQDAAKSYGEKKIWKHLNFTMETGETIGIVGASGIGKTTLFRILMGLTNIDSGEILGLEGKKISAVFQEDRLCEHISPIENIAIVCEKIDKRKREEIAQTLLKILPKDCLDKPVVTLSGGMKRRVAIARALIVKSDLILMDEPFQGLDSENKKRVIAFILKYQRNRSLCIITHHKEEINAFPNSRVFDICSYQ